MGSFQSLLGLRVCVCVCVCVCACWRNIEVLWALLGGPQAHCSLLIPRVLRVHPSAAHCLPPKPRAPHPGLLTGPRMLLDSGWTSSSPRPCEGAQQVFQDCFFPLLFFLFFSFLIFLFSFPFFLSDFALWWVLSFLSPTLIIITWKNSYSHLREALLLQ